MKVLSDARDLGCCAAAGAEPTTALMSKPVTVAEMRFLTTIPVLSAVVYAWNSMPQIKTGGLVKWLRRSLDCPLRGSHHYFGGRELAYLAARSTHFSSCPVSVRPCGSTRT